MKILQGVWSIAFLLAALTSTAQHSKSWTIYFPTDVHTLDHEDSTALAEAVRWIGKLENFSIAIQGHTDSVGSWAYNKALSMRRANAAKAYFVANNLPVDNVEIKGWSFEKPAANNQTTAGRQDNRRTTITVHFDRFKSSPQVKKRLSSGQGETRSRTTSGGTAQRIVGRRSEVNCDANNEAEITSFYQSSAVIKGQEGTRLFLPTNSLQNYANGQTIQVKMLELVRPEAIIDAKASTYSDGQLLKSAGMAFFKISVENLPAQLKECVEVQIPAPKIDGMRPYLTPGNGDIRRANWKELPTDQMRYDAQAQAYVVKVCDSDELSAMNGSFGVNIDKPVSEADEPPVLVRVKNRKGSHPIPTIVHEDGTVTNLRQVVPEEGLSTIFKRQYYLFPNTTEAMTVSDSFEQNGKTYEVQEVVFLEQDSNGAFRKSKSKRLRGKNRTLLKCPKFKYKKRR